MGPLGIGEGCPGEGPFKKLTTYTLSPSPFYSKDGRVKGHRVLGGQTFTNG